jgi:hypothetical protein
MVQTKNPTRTKYSMAFNPPATAPRLKFMQRVKAKPRAEGACSTN